ncbi:MAG: glutathione S-transferase family protein [Pseudomonadota bacterium]
MIQIYGTRSSRAFRCLWALEESALDYELVPVDWQNGDTRQPDFLALNPNGHVPVFQDGALTMVESLAINLHISDIAASTLSPIDPTERSKAIEWTLWAMGELEGPHDSANRRDTDVDDALRRQAFGVLNQHLGQTPYLIADRFSVADLNVASVLMRPKYMTHVPAFDHLDAWFKNCATRPALGRALAG